MQQFFQVYLWLCLCLWLWLGSVARSVVGRVANGWPFPLLWRRQSSYISFQSLITLSQWFFLLASSFQFQFIRTRNGLESLDSAGAIFLTALNQWQCNYNLEALHLITMLLQLFLPTSDTKLCEELTTFTGCLLSVYTFIPENTTYVQRLANNGFHYIF